MFPTQVLMNPQNNSQGFIGILGSAVHALFCHCLYLVYMQLNLFSPWL